MFDVGFAELLLISVIGLIVIGPDKLPGAARTAGKYIAKIKRSVAGIQQEVKRELDADELRKTLQDNGSLGTDINEFGRALTQDIMAPDTKAKSNGATELAGAESTKPESKKPEQ